MTQLKEKGQGFGTAPVFFTALSTILGAIMFLRFGYAVGNVGLIGACAIIFLGHLVTIPTAMAIAEIATNQKVEGGGEYYIISRSFGINIGASIGIALYLSQAISVAFYIIAFSQAFEPVFAYAKEQNIWLISTDFRIVSIPAMLLLVAIVLWKGADLGVKTLYVVVSILFASLIFFFAGSAEKDLTLTLFNLNHHIAEPDNFFYVFAICFPAFTGMTAGVGLSGDLEKPRISIPRGTLWATFGGMIIYLFIVVKLYISASPEELSQDQLIMQKISYWGPIIPLGLAAATLSSAIGSILVAPRTLQALAMDEVFPSEGINRWLSKGSKKMNEPINATIITSILAIFFILIGDVNFVAEIISMFFMVTYGAICTISFLEHFTSDPSYRPTFRSRWYLSLLGALACIFLMFEINAVYAVMSLISMILMYIVLLRSNDKSKGVASIFQGVIFQISREMRVYLQKANNHSQEERWRPSIVCISGRAFQNRAAFDMLRWLSHKYGFGTYMHFIPGYLSRETHFQSKEIVQRLIKMAEYSRSNVYIDTIISPSLRTAIAQLVQLPGISGKENNMVLFEYDRKNIVELEEIVSNFPLIKATDFDVCILSSTERNFGFNREIHIWITSFDYENANLMILLAYIIVGHPQWSSADIKLFAHFGEDKAEEQKELLIELINSGRLPISVNNVDVISTPDIDSKQSICEKSQYADLTIIGVRQEAIKHHGIQVFSGYESLGDVLFVNTTKQKELV